MVAAAGKVMLLLNCLLKFTFTVAVSVPAPDKEAALSNVKPLTVTALTNVKSLPTTDGR